MCTELTTTTAGMGACEAHKRELLGNLAGTVLEIGAGGGVNFSRFPAGIDWLGLEPSRSQRRRLARNAAAYGHDADIIAAPAERIPLPDVGVDAVVCTLVLCSVADQHRALAEIRRVLRPGGVFVFFEHVAAAPGTWSRRLQRGRGLISGRLGGCDPGRDTGQAIEATGFRAVDARLYAGTRIFGVDVPILGGVAHA